MVGMAELFDKTWFVALLYSLKYAKDVVFWGCFLALFAHTIIAVAIGYSINRLIPLKFLHFAATALYTFFAFLYLKDWYYADPDSDIIESGKAEVGEELGDAVAAELDKEAGHGKPSAEAVGTKSEVPEVVYEADVADANGSKARDEAGEEDPLFKEVDGKSSKANSASRSRGGFPAKQRKSMPLVFLECWMAMFIAEWGDRTQIAMIGQHASQPLIPVCCGSLLAFFLLTISAVAVGMCMDGVKLSEKKVHLVSSISFFVFAALSMWDGLSAEAPAAP
uniref:GDT1 family protein n=1 Tax=Zooxanthella nutricula TaxID=1333877 RepID=A0A7S2MXY6_9DINO